MLLNENKHLIIINRLNNKVYFFFPNVSGKMSLSTFRFTQDFQIYSADSSGHHLLVYSKDRVMVLNVTDYITSDPNRKKEWVQDLEEKQLKSIIAYDSKVKECENKDKEKNTFEEYTFKVNDAKIKDDKLIMKVEVEKQEVKYLRVLNFSTKTTLYYLENSSLLISGDKNYIWLLNEN